MSKLNSGTRIGTVLVCSLALILLSAGTANAAWQPDKPVELIVPAGSGGGADVMARFVAPLIEKYKLSPKPFIVVNKSGGAGAEGFMYVKGKKGDPNVIIITLDNLFTTPLATGVPFSWKDLTPGFAARPRLFRPLGECRISVQDRPGVPGCGQEGAGKIQHGRHRLEAGGPDHHGHVRADRSA